MPDSSASAPTPCARGRLPTAVLAGMDRARCARWVHAERLVHKLLPVTAAQRRAVDLVRQLIWSFYRDLKDWQCQPDRRRAAALRARFERIFRRRIGYVTLDRLLARLHERKAELLRVLDRPEIPLHTNGSENDIRAHVTKRKISDGTQSEAGRVARDVLLGQMKTCAKLGLSFFAYPATASACPKPPPLRPSRSWFEPRLQPDPPGILPRLLASLEHFPSDRNSFSIHKMLRT